jgi:ATP-dependent RNA helicase DDX49/DBP8
MNLKTDATLASFSSLDNHSLFGIESTLFFFSQSTMASLFGNRKRKRKTEDHPQDTVDVTKDDLQLSAVEESALLTSTATLEDLGLAAPLVATCRQLGFKRPTPVQRTVIPFLIQNDSAHLLALAATGTGKTASFCLPIIHRLVTDPYGIYAVVLTPTRELAKQIHQQVIALGSAYAIKSALVVGGLNSVKQSTELDQRPHFVIATPGRLAQLLRGPQPPKLRNIRYMVLDEADRLLATNSGFERDVAELLLHCTTEPEHNDRGDEHSLSLAMTNRKRRSSRCQTLLFSATLTKSLEAVEELAGAGLGRLPLRKFVIPSEQDEKEKVADVGDDEKADNFETHLALTPRIPAGLKQEYVFMPSRVRDSYLLVVIRTFMANSGKRIRGDNPLASELMEPDDDAKARSAIVFVATCERAGFVSGLLSNLGIDNVALHSLLSQNRRLAALEKFKSQRARVLVATDVASRGLDIPAVDLVINAELPRSPVAYVHRVGRTARAGRRGRAISLVAESDIGLVHAAERISGRPLEKCKEVTDDAAIKVLGPVAKAARLTRMKLDEVGFDDLVQKFKERKARDKKDRERIERCLQRMKKIHETSQVDAI